MSTPSQTFLEYPRRAFISRLSLRSPVSTVLSRFFLVRSRPDNSCVYHTFRYYVWGLNVLDYFWQLNVWYKAPRSKSAMRIMYPLINKTFKSGLLFHINAQKLPFFFETTIKNARVAQKWYGLWPFFSTKFLGKIYTKETFLSNTRSDRSPKWTNPWKIVKLMWELKLFDHFELFGPV